MAYHWRIMFFSTDRIQMMTSYSVLHRRKTFFKIPYILIQLWAWARLHSAHMPFYWKMLHFASIASVTLAQRHGWYHVSQRGTEHVYFFFFFAYLFISYSLKFIGWPFGHYENLRFVCHKIDINSIEHWEFGTTRKNVWKIFARFISVPVLIRSISRSVLFSFSAWTKTSSAVGTSYWHSARVTTWFVPTA